VDLPESDSEWVLKIKHMSDRCNNETKVVVVVLMILKAVPVSHVFFPQVAVLF